MTTQAALTLIPASNFEVRKLDRVKLQVSRREYILLSGWAIFDKQANAYVRFPGGRIQILGQDRYVDAPWTSRTKKLAVEVCEQGLYDCYLTIAI